MRMMGVSLYAMVVRAPDDGGGAASGSGDASASAGAGGGNGGSDASSNTALGGAAASPAAGADQTQGQPEPAAPAGKESQPSGEAAETDEQREARIAEERKNETPEAKEAREAAEREEAAKHAPAEGKYEPFTLPDGYEMADDDQARFTQFAVDNDMNQERAQQAIDLYMAQRAKENQQWFDQVDKWKETAASDPEIGGKDRAEKLSVMVKARDMFGHDPELVEVFNTAGIGDHPALQRFFYRVGKQFGDGQRTVTGDGPAATSATRGQRLYGG